MQLDKDLNLELARRLRLLARRYPTGDPTRTLLMLSAEGLKAAYGDQDYPNPLPLLKTRRPAGHQRFYRPRNRRGAGHRG